MTKTLFITGATGFIGSKLLCKLSQLQYNRIYCLVRDTTNVPEWLQTNGTVQLVHGDLHDCQTYAAFLDQSDTVIHLAAVTGKAPKETYFHVNASGTQQLLAQSKQSEISNFLFMSTIAVKYPDKSHYPYAQSKELSEQIVQESGLPYTIIRPTIVLGQDSSIWQSLSMMANAPIMPVFGNGLAQIQPIHIDDLTDCLVSILQQDTFTNEIIELGGPDKISFETFLRKIRQAGSNQKTRVVHLPLRPLTTILLLLEKGFQSLLPVTAGQLSAFNNDGTIQNNRIFDEHVTSMKDVHEMIEVILQNQQQAMPVADTDEECHMLTDYLIGDVPNDYVREKYREAHSMTGLFVNRPKNGFDQFLFNLSLKHTLLTKLVDSYTVFFFKGGLFRKKLILLMAILESCAPSYEHFEKPDTNNVFILLLKMAVKGIGFALFLLVSVLIFTPIRLLLSVVPRRRRGEG